MADKTQDANFGLDPGKPVLLVIDDSAVNARLWAGMAMKKIPGVQAISVDAIAGQNVPDGHGSTEYKPGALDILFHPRLKVAAVIADNNFPLVAGGTARSTTRFVGSGAAAAEAQAQELDAVRQVQEGAAGIMLVRLLKGGTLALESEWSKRDLAEAPHVRELLELQREGRLKPLVEERFADMPVLWNTGTFTRAKVASLEDAIAGKLLAPDDPRIRDEAPTGQPAYALPNVTMGVAKQVGNAAGYAFLEEHTPKRLARLAQEAEVPNPIIPRNGTRVEPEPEAHSNIARQ